MAALPSVSRDVRALPMSPIVLLQAVSLALALEVIHSARQVSEKAVENMQKTLQKHVEGHHQLDQIQRSNQAYSRVVNS